MTWTTFFRTGHRASCPVHRGRSDCHCESFLYNVLGASSLMTGIAQVSYGYSRSLAATTDALHGFVDSSTDFYGSWLVWKIQQNPERAEMLNRQFNRYAGLLLIVGVLFLWWELVERLIHGYGAVSVTAIVILGSLGAVIDGFRLWLLTQARKLFRSERHHAMLAHIRSDLWHSLWVLAIGLMLVLATRFDQQFATYLPTFDAVGTALIGLYMFMLAKGLLTATEHHHGHHGHEHRHHHD